MNESLTAAILDAPDDVVDFNRWAMEHRWGDGLPLVPPTPQRVAGMLEAFAAPPHDVVARIPPRWSAATVELIAANAVMAGCLPSHLAVVVGAVAALADPAVNLYGAQATTHPCSTMVMVNGPVAAAIGMNSGAGLFGPGNVANATIGRAVRLCMQNIGGAYPGEADRSTLGSPAKFTFCFAENEAASPWTPHHVDRGFAADESTVTVVAAEAPQNIADHVSTDPERLLGTIAHTMASVGANNAYCRGSDLFVGICPEHARVLAAAGMDKRAVSDHLFRHARIPLDVWTGRGSHGIFPPPPVDTSTGVPMTDRSEDIHVIVVGGPGLHSCWIPTLGISRSHTALLRDATGEPLRPRA